MRDLAVAADRIDYWIRRHVFQHYPSQSRLNPARDRRVGLSAIGQCLKDQYAAAATPIHDLIAGARGRRTPPAPRRGKSRSTGQEWREEPVPNFQGAFRST
jgi:hypothetical protein